MIDGGDVLWNYPQVNISYPELMMHIGSGNGLVLSGTKQPLPEPMLTQNYVAIMVSLGSKEFKVYLHISLNQL